MKRTQFLTGISALVLSLSFSAWADDVADGDLVEFSAGTTAVAAEVNSNFSTLQSAINGTHKQVQRLDSDVSDMQPLISEACPAGEAVASIAADGTVSCVKTVPVDTRVISVSAQALNINANREGDTYDRRTRGLRWRSTFAGGAHWALRKPADYAGGEVTFTVWFTTTTDKSGNASFFIRPRSLAHGDSVATGASSITSPQVPVSSAETVYEQNFAISGSLMQADWWEILLQRKGADASVNPESYDDDVTVRSVAIEYPVVNQ